MRGALAVPAEFTVGIGNRNFADGSDGAPQPRCARGGRGSAAASLRRGAAGCRRWPVASRADECAAAVHPGET